MSNYFGIFKKIRNLRFLLKSNYFLIIVILYVIYSLLLIYRSSFVINSTRYFSLFDDEMISMRYAYNFAHGHGLVWNPGGERVEGITNPLWTFVMSFVHLFPINTNYTSLVIQIMSLIISVLFLYFCYKLLKKFTQNSVFYTCIGIILIAFYFPYNNWLIIQGTEVGLILLVTIYFVYSLLVVKRSIPFFGYFLLGLGIWTRMDFTLTAVFLTLSSYFYSKKKNNLRAVIIGLTIISAFVISEVLARIWYYKDIFPNTYYLKMTGYPILFRIVRGIYVTVKEINPIFILIPTLFVILTKNKIVILLLSIFMLQFLYSMFVGGDAWEFFGGTNRYLLVGFPFLIISLCIVMATLQRKVVSTRLKSTLNYKFTQIFAVVVLFIMLNTGSDNMLLYATLIKQFPTSGENENQIKVALALKRVTNAKSKIGIVQAGTAPYFSLDRKYADLLGKSDKHISRTSGHIDLNSQGLRKYLGYWPGHTKWDYTYVVSKLKPDVFGQVWPESETIHLNDKYVRHVSSEGYVFYIIKQQINN